MSGQQTQQREKPETTDPYGQFEPVDLLVAANLVLQKRNTELEYTHGSEQWQIKGLTKQANKQDANFTQREAFLKKAVGFLEGAFGGGFRWQGKWLQWVFIGLIVVGGYAYLNANPQIVQDLIGGTNIYWTTGLVSVVAIAGLYFFSRYRRSRSRA